MIVIGVDVGLRTTGYVICNVTGSQIELINDGQITTRSSQELGQRLHAIYSHLSTVIGQYSIETMVVEKLYSHYKHPVTLGVLAQVRGVVVLLAQECRLKLVEYSPTRARKAMLGRGSVRSSQVKRMSENVFKKKIRSQHIADALSLVVTFSHQYKVRTLSISH